MVIGGVRKEMVIGRVRKGGGKRWGEEWRW